MEKLEVHDFADYNGEWDLCFKLRELSVTRELDPKELKDILKTPKPFLKDLHLKFGDFKAMNAFATGVITSLESVEFECCFPPEGAFKSIVETNKRLEDVNIHVCGELPDHLGDKCGNLKSFQFGEHTQD